jgi:hypothetical protein
MQNDDFEIEKSAIETLQLRIGLCESALETITPDLYDPVYPELRADLLLAAESLNNTAAELLLAARKIAWQNTKIPRGGFSE